MIPDPDCDFPLVPGTEFPDASQAEVWRLTEEWYAQREALYDVRSEARRTRHGLIESEHRCTQLMLALSDAGVSVDPNLFVGSNSAAALLVLPAPSSTDPRDVVEYDAADGVEPNVGRDVSWSPMITPIGITKKANPL